MNTVFNSPVASDSVGKRFQRGETEQEVAGFPGDFLIDAPLRSHHPNPSQAFPPLLGIKVLQNRSITDGPVLPDFQTSMRLFDRTIRLALDGGKCLFPRQSKVLPLDMVDKSITPCEPISSRYFRHWTVRTGYFLPK